MKKVLMVVSGGMDSVTCLHEHAAEIGAAVSFNYGSNHNEKEIESAATHCRVLGIDHYIIDMREAFKSFKSGLLSGSKAIPEGHYEDATMKFTVVPFRNGIMLSIAAGLAESLELGGVMLASHAGDHAIYPDCRAPFNRAMNEAIYQGTETRIVMHYPYENLTKRGIAHKGDALGINWDSTWSCYKGGDTHCGRCSTCVERIWALKDLKDETTYLDKEFAINLLKERGEW